MVAQPTMKIKSDHGDTNKHIKISGPESGTYNKHLTVVSEPFSRAVLENNASCKQLQRKSNGAFQLEIIELVILC